MKRLALFLSLMLVASIGWGYSINIVNNTKHPLKLYTINTGKYYTVAENKSLTITINGSLGFVDFELLVGPNYSAYAHINIPPPCRYVGNSQFEAQSGKTVTITKITPAAGGRFNVTASCS